MKSAPVISSEPATWLVIVVLAVAYTLTGVLGMEVASPPGNVTSVWLPAGLALGALIRFGYRAWPGILLGSIACNLIVFPGAGPWTLRLLGAALIAMGSTTGLVVTRWLVERFVGLEALSSTGRVLRFMGCVALGCAINATGGMATTGAMGHLDASQLASFWSTWWMGDGVGMAALAPVALREVVPRPRRSWEWLGSVALLLLATQFLFGRPIIGLGGTPLPMAWVVLPSVVWAGSRLGAIGVAVQTVLLHVMVTWGTVTGGGPFAQLPRETALLMIDGLLMVVVATGLLLSAASAAVRSEQASLETRVQERTLALETANQALIAEGEERVRLAARLIEVQKQEALGRLAGGVAHDFNNLLTVISGEAELLARGPDATPGVQDGAGAILAATQRAAELTRQLLAVARRQPAAPRAVDVGELLAENRRLLRPLFPESVTLDLDCAPGCAVLIDPTQLDQIVLNLAINARDAISGTGSVKITGTRATLDVPQAAAVGLTPGQWVVLEVRDTGAGIAPDVVPRIFEPFFTTKRDAGGTGLGLSTVWGIANQARGTVRVQSALGQGTTFSVWLPFTEQAPTSLTTQPVVSKRTRTARILVVEDEPLVRRTVVLTLEREGYEVLTAGDGEEAMALFRKPDFAVDLVLTDVVMPRMGGLELARQLRAERKVPVLFMSGFHEHQAELSNEQVLGKPFAQGHLLAVVNAALHRT